LIWDRSGLSTTYGIKTLGGVIDSCYRGEILYGLTNLSSAPYTVEKGHKAVQMLIQKVETAEIVEVDTLSDTSRGEGGFGSTGK
jgi:dUTP pyrophosphatase